MYSEAKACPLYYSPAEDYFFYLKMNPGRPSYVYKYIYIPKKSYRKKARPSVYLAVKV